MSEEIRTRHERASYKLVTSEELLDELIMELSNAVLIGFDTETTGLDLMCDDPAVVCGLCFSTKPYTGWYVPIRHEVAEGCLDDRQLDSDYVLQALKPLLESKPLVGHNTKFDYKMMLSEGIECNFTHDTLIQATLIGRFAPGTRGLKSLTYSEFGHKHTEIHEVVPQYSPSGKLVKPKDINFHFYGIEAALDYAAGDADWTLQLHHKLYPELESTINHEVYGMHIYDLEVKLVPVVCRMEMAGVPLDVDFMDDMATKAAAYLHKLDETAKQEIWNVCGETFEINLNSPAQLSDLLFNRLGISTEGKKRTKSGGFSTDGETLQSLASEHPFLRYIITYKTLKKLHSSFLTKVRKQAFHNRIYANFNQLGTDTGRFSSSNPNMQQIPKAQHFFITKMDTDEKWEEAARRASTPVESFREIVNTCLHADDVQTPSDIPSWQSVDGTWYSLDKEDVVWEAWVCPSRNAIKASSEHYIVEADYSQIEIRVFAGESQEPNLLTAYQTGEDIHTRTAALVFNTPIEKVTPKQRSHAKTINFGIIYGATAKTISDKENIPIEEAQDIVFNYFRGMPKAKEWIEKTKQQVRRDHCSRTKFGRIRDFNYLFNQAAFGNQHLIASAEREGVNAVVQGTAADIMKRALVRLDHKIHKQFAGKAKLIMTVHDSLMLEVHESVLPHDIVNCVYEAMVFDIPSYPPLDIDVQIGSSWGDGKEIGREEEAETPVSLAAPPSNIEWVLEIFQTPTSDQIEQLKEFLRDRVTDGTRQFLTLKFEMDDGRVVERRQAKEFHLSFNDEPMLRRVVGSCKLRQSIKAFDYKTILGGITDDDIFRGE